MAYSDNYLRISMAFVFYISAFLQSDWTDKLQRTAQKKIIHMNDFHLNSSLQIVLNLQRNESWLQTNYTEI